MILKDLDEMGTAVILEWLSKYNHFVSLKEPDFNQWKATAMNWVFFSKEAVLYSHDWILMLFLKC